MLQKVSKCEAKAKNEFLQVETLAKFRNSEIHFSLNFGKINISKIAIFTLFDPRLLVLVNFRLEKLRKFTKIKTQTL